MHHHPRRIRDIQSAIRRVLLTQWDPIGVAGVSEAADEYDGYVGPVYRLLISGASDQKLAKYLAGIQVHAMGLHDPGWRALLPVAHTLQKEFSVLDSVSPAT